ncbi:MAG: FecR family protein [Alphaproteobacteria bacterium]
MEPQRRQTDLRHGERAQSLGRDGQGRRARRGANALRGLACLFAIVATLPAIAAESRDIATAEKVVRDVYGGALAYRIEARAALRSNEQINTGPKSAVHIVFVDKTDLFVGESAALALDSFVFDPDRKTLSGAADLTKGALRFVGSGASKAITIRTPNATLGIRGTSFDLRVGTGSTEILVRSGSVELASDGGQKTTVGQGQYVAVAGGAIAGGAPPSDFTLAFQQLAQAIGPQAARAEPSGLAEVRDASGALRGYTVVQPSGRIDALNANRVLVAFYDPRTNATYAANGRKLSDGNTLLRLMQGQH